MRVGSKLEITMKSFTDPVTQDSTWIVRAGGIVLAGGRGASVHPLEGNLRRPTGEIDEILVYSRRIQNFVDLDVQSPGLTGPFRGTEAGLLTHNELYGPGFQRRFSGMFAPAELVVDCGAESWTGSGATLAAACWQTLRLLATTTSACVRPCTG